MAKKLLGLSDDGHLVVKLPSGVEEPVPIPQQARAFLLIDCSDSMSGSKLSEAKEGASAFALDARKKRYSVGLIKFATTAEVLCKPEDPFAALSSTISSLETDGSTNMADAIKLATQELMSLPGTKAIVIATDGMPDNKAATLEASHRAKASGIDIIAIGTGDADQDFLGDLASRLDLAIMVRAAELKDGILGAVKLLPGVRRER